MDQLKYFERMIHCTRLHKCIKGKEVFKKSLEVESLLEAQGLKFIFS